MAGAMNEQVNLTLVQSYKRAERPDETALEDTFVPINALNNLLRSPEHHILYGRRGTGKTHILRHLTRQERDDGIAAIYIDLRTIGSSGGLYADSSIPVPARATTLLTDIITAIHTEILDLVLSDEQFAKYLDAAGPVIDDLLDAASHVLVRAGGDEEPAAAAGHDGHAGPRARAAAAGTDRDQGTYHVVFGRLTAVLERVVRTFDGRGLWIMLDEWSSLPIELQPFLADLLRRSAFTVPGITIKIGAIERRSRFMEHRPHGSYIGIEPGADTAASLDIDDYLTFEHDRQEVEAFFAEVLCRHVTSFQRLAGAEPLFSTADEFLRTAFAQLASFKLLITFSEGIPRDALQIAALSAALAGRSAISTAHVRRANRDYFRRDKEGRLSRSATGALNEIIEQCIAGETRLIALRRSTPPSAAVVAELYDMRLLHRRGQSVQLPDRPYTEKYDLFLVDIGCFQDLLQAGTLRAIDEGGREPGIVSTAGRRDRDPAAPRPSYVLIQGSQRWR
jgi:hypothetical protein